MKKLLIYFVFLFLIGCASHDDTTNKMLIFKVSTVIEQNNNRYLSKVQFFKGEIIIKEIGYLNHDGQITDSTVYCYQGKKLIYKITYDLSFKSAVIDTVKYFNIDNYITIEFQQKTGVINIKYLNEDSTLNRKIILFNDFYSNSVYLNSEIFVTTTDKNLNGEVIVSSFIENWYENKYLDSTFKRDTYLQYDKRLFNIFHSYPVSYRRNNADKLIQVVSIPEESGDRFYDGAEYPLLDSIKIVLNEFTIEELYKYYNNGTFELQKFEYSNKKQLIEVQFFRSNYEGLLSTIHYEYSETTDVD